MTSDGPSMLMVLLGGALSLAFAFCVGAVCANDAEREQRTRLGFSSRLAGACVCLLTACACFMYGLCRLRLALWLALLIFLLLCAALIICAALGGTRRGENAEAFALLRPIGLIFSAPAQLLFSSLRLTAQSDVTEEDLLSMVDDVEEQDLIDENQKEMITNIVDLADVTAGEIMTHRTEVVSIPEDMTAAAAVQLAAKEGVSRMPVYRKTIDDIAGMLYVKDLFHAWDDPVKSSMPVHDFVRPAMFVPEACRARELLIEFRLKHMHIAIVVDEYGGTSGVVSMEDVLEEIVGNIQDEFDNEDEEIAPQPDGSVLAAGSADLEDVFKALSMERPEDTAEDDDFDTVGGLVTDRLGRIPAEGESVSVPFGGVLFTVVKAADRRIATVRCTRMQESEDLD